jgi:hypothetical protein
LVLILPANVDRFLRTSFRSLWELELLLMLHRQNSRQWTADDLVHELRASVLIIADALEALQKAGLVVKSRSDAYQYRPASPELDNLVGEVRSVYAGAPVAVTEAILSAPNSSVRTFAEAFKIKRE